MSQKDHTYNVPEYIRGILADKAKSVDAHKFAMDHHAAMAKQKTDEFWNVLRNECPDLDFAKHVYRYDVTTHSLVLSRSGKSSVEN